MFVKKFNIIIVVIICILNASIVFGQEWKLKKNRRGIKVYTRKVDGSHFKESKAIMEINTSLASLVFLLTDVKNLTQWYPNLKKCEILKNKKDMEYLMYQVIDLPWPVRDRDSVINFTMAYNNKDSSVTITYNDVSNYVVKKKGLIRIKSIKAYWKFIPNKDGSTKVIYQVHGEPGGKLPAWLTNITSVDNPYKIFKKIRKTVMKPKYQNATLSKFKHRFTP